LGTATKPVEIAKSASDKKLLAVYPNPAHTKINVNLTGYKSISEMKLYDANGKQVAVYRTPQVNTQIDISKFANGLYLLKIITSNGEIISSKVIKE